MRLETTSRGRPHSASSGLSRDGCARKSAEIGGHHDDSYRADRGLRAGVPDCVSTDGPRIVLGRSWGWATRGGRLQRRRTRIGRRWLRRSGLDADTACAGSELDRAALGYWPDYLARHPRDGGPRVELPPGRSPALVW